MVEVVRIDIPPGEECGHCHVETKGLLHKPGTHEPRLGDEYFCMMCGAQSVLVEDGLKITGLRLSRRDLVEWRRRVLR